METLASCTSNLTKSQKLQKYRQSLTNCTSETLQNYNRLKLQWNQLNYQYWRLSVHKRIIRENEAKGSKMN